MQKHSKDDRHYTVCDICGIEIKLHDPRWINSIHYETKFFNEMYEKEWAWSSSSIDICPNCLKKGEELKNNAEILYTKYIEGCREIIDKWKQL